ncbi:MAG: hypothetical protein ACE5E4_12470 [Candidatus Binatia bacterium]
MQTLTSTVPKPYLSTCELSELTPWSEQAIRTMVSRGVLKFGIHYFKPRGFNGRPIFSWRAIVDYIEGSFEPNERGHTIPLANGVDIDLNEAKKATHRLHG